VNPRLLVLTAGFGEGHNAAARAVASAWDRHHGPEQAHVADVLALAAPRLNRRLRPAYLQLINRYPRLWSAAYRWLDGSRGIQWMISHSRAEQRALSRLVATHRPAAICSCYPAYGLWLRRLAQRRPSFPPYFHVVTDSISINSLWWTGGGEAWFVPNAESAEVVAAGGVPRDRLLISGFPVSLEFEALAARLRPSDLQDPAARPAVLQMVHSGTRGAAETARQLLQHPTWEITCAVGRDEHLRTELNAIAERRSAPTRILGWTDEIPRLLHTHHVVISKAGGATTQEALAAGCPMIVNQIVPGQEEGNYELLRRHGIGALATTADAILDVIESAFANQGERWNQWRSAALRLSRPAAARHIVQALSDRLNPHPPSRSTTSAHQP
jgi:processive 1,2-diacylglycerol beta-glucosyltransferase